MRESAQPSTKRKRRQRRLAITCGATLAAAVFTPVSAIADTAAKPIAPTIVLSELDSVLPAEQLAALLISGGMIGVGLAMGGLVVVAHRRRQW